MMKKLLAINPVVRTSTSTGKIMREIGALASKNGWESYIAFGAGRDRVPALDSEGKFDGSTPVPVGGRLSVAFHGLLTRLTDRHGLGSTLATKRFINKIKRIDPDVVHIHNVHGYFLNYKLLFDYLSECGKPVIWTVHDCWLYTGHCYYYTAAGCDRWKTGCGCCPQKKAFPTSWIVDRSAANFKDKSAAFNSLGQGQFLLAPVSEWIRGEMAESFLKDRQFRVIHNGIDTDVFRPCEDGKAVREKYGLGEKSVILGLASIWSKEKGLDDFVELSHLIDKDKEVIVLVGIKEAQRQSLPEGVVAIGRTDSREELAQLYSEATAFVNPTWQDNYPTVNLEAISCGTPVVTYRTGGSPESIVEGETGYVIEQGDVAGLLDNVRLIEKNGKDFYRTKCREYALAHFSKEERYLEYLKLYEEKISGNQL